jgi:hypothetical protein
VSKCRSPVNRLLLMRKRNLCGPMFQNIGGGVCAKSVGPFIESSGGFSLMTPEEWVAANGGDNQAATSDIAHLIGTHSLSFSGATIAQDATDIYGVANGASTLTDGGGTVASAFHSTADFAAFLAATIKTVVVMIEKGTGVAAVMIQRASSYQGAVNIDKATGDAVKQTTSWKGFSDLAFAVFDMDTHWALAIQGAHPTGGSTSIYYYPAANTPPVDGNTNGGTTGSTVFAYAWANDTTIAALDFGSDAVSSGT